EDGKADPAKGEERGKDYNHSTYCDLIINGLIGIRPQEDDTIAINPLAPDTWDYFCLDGVRYHGRAITVLFDRTGQKYRKGKGLRILADGKEIAAAASLSPLRGRLNASPSEQQPQNAEQSVAQRRGERRR
ncbi:MAG: glycosyl hydrolase family 65 protein, partial [Verrucomicrobiae bacterium]